MAVPVIMPRQGQSVESCIIAKWHKKKGDKVSKGDLLFTYETDKATFDEEAPEDGILLAIFAEENDDVPVLTTVCVIGREGEDISGFVPGAAQEQKTGTADTVGASSGDAAAAGSAVAASATDSDRAAIAAGSAVATSAPGSSDTADAAHASGTFGSSDAAGAGKAASADVASSASAGTAAGEPKGISPRAKNLAERTGVIYQGAEGSGPAGRIIEKDIRRLQEEGRIASRAVSGQAGIPAGAEGTGLGGRITTKDTAGSAAKAADDYKGIKVSYASQAGAPVAGAPEAEYRDEKLTNIRKIISQTMHYSLSSTAQLTLNSSFDATSILELRNKIKARGKELGLANITLNDMVLYAVARTLPEFGGLNAHFFDDTIRIFKNVNLGVAVDTDRGLMVPTLFSANRMTLGEISGEARRLAEACRNRTISPDYLQGGTFTVTNLGALGIESFTPILNPPQTGILGVSGIVQRVRDGEKGIETYPAMGLSLTIDHRAVDGAPAARFLKTLAERLENFQLFVIM